MSFEMEKGSGKKQTMEQGIADMRERGASIVTVDSAKKARVFNASKKSDRNDFLRNLLDCGEDDLTLLDGIGFHYADVLKEMGWPHSGSINFNTLVDTIGKMGLDNLKQAIDDRMADPNISDEELEVLNGLNVDSDIEVNINYSASEFVLINNTDIYTKHLQNALNLFYEQTGFEILS